ncbi:hypothetical protein BUE80_DR012372 [Diplocarpon rosae]|nr:hypothetical protein BUE80_DR012372 [Diplocarpon rosae]
MRFTQVFVLASALTGGVMASCTRYTEQCYQEAVDAGFPYNWICTSSQDVPCDGNGCTGAGVGPNGESLKCCETNC